MKNKAIIGLVLVIVGVFFFWKALYTEPSLLLFGESSLGRDTQHSIDTIPGLVIVIIGAINIWRTPYRNEGILIGVGLFLILSSLADEYCLPVTNECFLRRQAESVMAATLGGILFISGIITFIKIYLEKSRSIDE
jgi:hypothetical protein